MLNKRSSVLTFYVFGPDEPGSTAPALSDKPEPAYRSVSYACRFGPGRRGVGGGGGRVTVSV